LLEVLGEASISVQPSQRMLDDPAPLERLESLGSIGSLDDFDGPLADPAKGIGPSLRPA
jgi:hypothetical protein